jgi:hypothetical protein
VTKTSVVVVAFPVGPGTVIVPSHPPMQLVMVKVEVVIFVMTFVVPFSVVVVVTGQYVVVVYVVIVVVVSGNHFFSNPGILATAKPARANREKTAFILNDGDISEVARDREKFG